MKDGPKWGGTFNADKHWKKLREKHRKTEHIHQTTGRRRYTPEVYKANDVLKEGTAREVSQDLYDLNYDLAFGRITEDEYNLRRKALDDLG